MESVETNTILSTLKKNWIILIFIAILAIMAGNMSNKASSLNIDTVNENIENISPITKTDGSALALYSIFPDKNNATDEFQFTLPLQQPLEGSLMLDESHNIMKKGNQNLPTWSSLFKNGDKYQAKLDSNTIEWLQDPVVYNNFGAGLYNDFNLVNFQFASSYRSYLYIHQTSGGTHYFCHPRVIEHVILQGARCIHLDVFGDADNNPIVYYGTKATQVSANRMSLKRCFMVVKNLLDVDESEFKNPNSPYNGKYFLHDPMFITLTLKTHNPTVISQIVNIYNDIFTSERQAPAKEDYSNYLGHQPIWKYKRRVSIISSPIGDQYAIHNTFFDGDKIREGLDDNEKQAIINYDNIVQHYWGVPTPNRTSNTAFGNIAPENATYGSLNMYNVQSMTDELRSKYRHFISQYIGAIFPCSTGGSMCEVADIYVTEDGKEIGPDRELKRQNAQKSMVNSLIQNSCQLNFDKIWSTGAQFIYMYYQRPTDGPFIKYIDKFIQSQTSIVYKFSNEGGIGGGGGNIEAARFRLFVSVVAKDVTARQQLSDDADKKARDAMNNTNTFGGEGGGRWKSNDWKNRLHQTNLLIKNLTQ